MTLNICWNKIHFNFDFNHSKMHFLFCPYFDCRIPWILHKNAQNHQMRVWRIVNKSVWNKNVNINFRLKTQIITSGPNNWNTFRRIYWIWWILLLEPVSKWLSGKPNNPSAYAYSFELAFVMFGIEFV